MADVTITNLTNREVYIKDLYDSLDPFEVMVIQRSMGQLSSMVTLHQAVRDGIVDVVYTMDSVERYLSGDSGGGGSTTASNVGIGEGSWFKIKSGDDLQFKTLKAGPNIVVTNGTNEVTVETTAGSVGSIFVVDVTGQSGGVVGSKVFIDPPNNTILESCVSYTPDIVVSLRSSHPQVMVGGVAAVLSAGSGWYVGTVTVSGISGGPIDAHINVTGGSATSVDVALDSPPQVLTLVFSGGYPGTQTEYKAGDTAHITGTTDKAATTIQVLNFGACSASSVGVSGTSFSIAVTIGSTGLTTTALRARCRAGNADGSFGATFDTTNTVNCNNTYPTISFGAITYPGSQSALKNSEQATVVFSYANTNTILFSSPTGDLTVTNPTVLDVTKLVTRASGSYNISTPNLQALATRTANAAQSTVQTVVSIAHVAAVITVSTPAARLRSGGNDGTAPQDYTIGLASNQNLASAPTLSAAVGGGVLQGVAWVGGPTTYSRALRVQDTDVKATYSWNSLNATNLAGLVTTTVAVGPTYTLGGFVPRSLTFPSFSQATVLNVPVTDYSKLQAGIFSATNQPATRTTVQGDHTNLADRFTVDTLMTNPTILWWNDQVAASSNSSGTAQIVNVEEVV